MNDPIKRKTEQGLQLDVLFTAREAEPASAVPDAALRRSLLLPIYMQMNFPISAVKIFLI